MYVQDLRVRSMIGRLNYHATNRKHLIKTVISQAMRDAILSKLTPSQKFDLDAYAKYFQVSEVVWNFEDRETPLRLKESKQQLAIVVVENDARVLMLSGMY